MTRSTLTIVVFSAGLTGLLILPALARQGTKMDPNAKSMTIEGAVRDLACPVQNPVGAATSFSLKCTMDCVRHGSPIIIITKDGFIYFPISANMPRECREESQANLNARGTLIGWADTTTPDPYPNFCFSGDCVGTHGFRWPTS